MIAASLQTDQKIDKKQLCQSKIDCTLVVFKLCKYGQTNLTELKLDPL